MLVLVEKPAGQIPEAFPGIEGATPQEHSTPLVEADRLCAGNGVRVAHIAAGPALGAVFDLLDSLAADRAEAPESSAPMGGTMHDQAEEEREE